MKKLAIMGATVLAVAVAQAQILEKDVPSAVRNAFTKEYPQAKEVEWEKEATNYEAEFEWNGKDHSVVLDAQGNILESEMEIKTDELPAASKKYISEKYPNQKVKEAARITLPNGAIQYEAEINGKDVMFDAQGNFVTEKSEEND